MSTACRNFGWGLAGDGRTARGRRGPQTIWAAGGRQVAPAWRVDRRRYVEGQGLVYRPSMINFLGIGGDVGGKHITLAGAKRLVDAGIGKPLRGSRSPTARASLNDGSTPGRHARWGGW